jgi:hypothetical protein
MKNLNVVKISLAVVVLLTALIWFLPDYSRKTIKGDYYLLEFDESRPPNYYVCIRGYEDTAGGVFDGVVEQLGIRNNKLFAKVKRLSSGDISGWYELNLDTGSVSGPLDYERDFAGLPVSASSDFFKNLD